MSTTLTTRPGQGLSATVYASRDLTGYTTVVELSTSGKFSSVTTKTPTVAGRQVSFTLSSTEVDSLKDCHYRVKATKSGATVIVDQGNIDYTTVDPSVNNELEKNIPARLSDATLRSSFGRIAAPTGVTATDTANIQNAINSGGIWLLAPGTYVVSGLQIKSAITLRGVSVGGTTIKLANGANADLITVPNFSTLTGGNTSGGESKFCLESMTLDGNGTNQTGTSWTFRVYASNYRIDDVEMTNGLSGNVYSEWATPGTGYMEAMWSRFKLTNPIGDTAVNLDWRGPHDSIFTSGEVVANHNANTLHQTGIWSRGNAGGEVFTGVHVWGFHQNGWIFDHSAIASDCEAEGAFGANILLRSAGVRWAGKIFGTNGFNATEVGVQVGDATFNNIRRCDINVDIFNWAAGAFPFNFFSSGGTNRFTGSGILGGATAPWTGTLNALDKFDIVFQDGTQDQSKLQIPQPVNIRTTSTTALVVGNLAYNAGVSNLELRGGGLTRGYTSGGTQSWLLSGANGAVTPGTTAGLGSQIFSGTGAPTISAVSGDYYFRKDTPTVANQRIYICTGATAWTAIL